MTRLPDPLLRAGDPPPVTLHRHGARSPALVVCDHASPEVPSALGRLGVAEADLARHIAWDIGAGRLALALARRLGVDAVLAGYSRLVIDCNRDPARPGSIVEASDGTVVPGNVGLPAAAREARIAAIFEPYHAAIAGELDVRRGLAPAPALIAVHSFTDRLGGRTRPWHCGVLWGDDDRLARPLIRSLRDEAGIEVGDNEPYSGRDPDNFTVDHHARAAGLPYACIEVRQDLLVDATGIETWAERLAAALREPLADPLLYRPWSGHAEGARSHELAADDAGNRGGIPVRRSGDR
jgi:predicted N-formylglutamate amidohydrolase